MQEKSADPSAKPSSSHLSGRPNVPPYSLPTISMEDDDISVEGKYYICRIKYSLLVSMDSCRSCCNCLVFCMGLRTFMAVLAYHTSSLSTVKEFFINQSTMGLILSNFGWDCL